MYDGSIDTSILIVDPVCLRRSISVPVHTHCSFVTPDTTGYWNLSTLENMQRHSHPRVKEPTDTVGFFMGREAAYIYAVIRSVASPNF